MSYTPPVTHGISGNTAGVTALISSGTYYLAGGNNITLSQAGNSVTVSAPNNAGTNGAITGGSLTVNTSGISINLPAYLTTAALSQDSSKYAFTGFTTTTSGGAVIAGTHNTDGLLLGVPAYLTTAMQSQSSSVFARTGFTTTTAAGATVVGTQNTDGLLLGVPSYLTTAALSGDTTKYAGVGETVGTVAGTDLAMTVNTDGVSILYPRWLTTAALSQDSSKYAGIGESTGTVAGTDLGLTVNTDGVSILYPNWLTTAALSQDSSKYAGIGETIGTTAGTDLKMTVNTDGVNISHPAWLTTAMASNRGSDFVQATAAFAGTNASGTIASNGISVSVNPGAATISMHEPMMLREGTATSTGSISNLHLVPFTLQENLSFGQINMIGSLSFPASSGGNTLTFRMGVNQSVSLSRLFTVSNQNIIDCFLFSRGSGSFSTELETFASTRNSIETQYRGTYFFTAAKTGTNCSRGLSYSLSAVVMFPGQTSGTVQNGATTHTTWGMGIDSWTSSASTQVATATAVTSNTASVSAVSTFPATTEWASNKMIPLMFATSLAPGEYWFGMARASNVTSSTDTAATWTSFDTNASYTSSYGASGWQQTGQVTWVGDTNTIASSLAWIGEGTAASLGAGFGLGSFSGTWDKATTYVNNAGNPAGAVAFSQVNTRVSFFRPWVQFASQRI